MNIKVGFLAILVPRGQGGPCLKTSTVTELRGLAVHLGDMVDKLALGVTCPGIGSSNPIIRKAVESE